MPDEQVALDNINFDIYDGEIVGIIGHTGSGKSTLLQHLNGLLKPHSGTIIIGDTDITVPGVLMRDIRKRVGLVFQYPEYQLFEETVYKDIAFGPKNMGLKEEEIDESYNDMLRQWRETPADWLDGETPAAYFDKFTDAGELVALIPAYDAAKIELPEPLYSRIMALGEKSVPALTALAEDAAQSQTVRATALSLLTDSVIAPGGMGMVICDHNIDLSL